MLPTILVALTLALASPLNAQQDSTDARVVIVVDSVDRAAFTNVAELLQARVPGLHIARTGDGGMRWFMRGPASVAESHPMVLVDDVRISVAGSAIPEMGTRPPLLDEIDIEHVERIEIWSGAATSSRYGTGAGNGVIRIVTATPRGGHTSFRVAAVGSALEDNAEYPANFNRPGIDTAGRGVRCTLHGEATGRCTPTGPPTSINVLESDSPFERAFGARVAASLSSGNEQLAWSGAATLDRQRSTEGNLANQRLHVRGVAAFRPSPTANVGLNGYWTRGDADLRPENPLPPTLLRQGLFARADAVWPGFVNPNVSIYHSARFGGSVKGRWRPRDWLDASLTSGIARMADEDDLEYVLTGVFDPPRQIDERGERRRRDWNARIDAEARYGIGAIRYATRLVMEHAVSKDEEEHRSVVTFPDLGPLVNAFWLNHRLAIAGLGLEQRMRLGQQATLLGGVRLEQVRVNDVRWEVPLARHVALIWDGSPFGAHEWGRVRLRAALGDVAIVPQTTRLFFFFAGSPERPKAEFTREREIGLDAKALQHRLELELTWYHKRTSNVGTAVFGPQPSLPGFRRIEVLNRGIEASVHARLLETSRFTWEARAWYAYNHNEVTRGFSTPLVIGFDPFNGVPIITSQWIGEGVPLGAHRSRPIVSLQDLDQDGLVDSACFEGGTPCEVVVRQAMQFHPAYPPTSASVATSLRFGAFTLRALVDHRSGHAISNTTRSGRCFRECQAIYDPSTSFRDQAEAILDGGGSGVIGAEDASYTKFRELSLQLEAPTSWARALGASRLDLSLAGRNVATWSDYSGLDPETTSMHWNPLVSDDAVAEPLPRRFSIRVTATK